MNRKLYKCKHPDCNIQQAILSKGLCNYHRNMQRQADGSLPKYTNKIKQISTKRKLARKEERGCLKGFFDYHIRMLEKNPYSEESGDRIYEPSVMHVAHLLPKRKQGGFPSVQCNIDNIIYLLLSEHSRMDKLLDERRYTELEKEFPNSIKKIRNRMKKVLSLCTERNKTYFALTEYLENRK